MKTKLLRAFDEGWNKGNIDAMVALCTPGFIHHRPPFPDISGIPAEKEDIETAFKLYSDIYFKISEIILEGDTVALRWTWQAKPKLPSDDIPSDKVGKEVSLEGCSILHLENGKIAEEWEFADYLSFYTQLGKSPPFG